MGREISHQNWIVNGIRMHVAIAGDGPPMVLLHGFPELWYSWRKVMPRLAETYCVVAPDMRGYGKSEIPKKGYDIDTLSKDIVDLIDQLGGKAILVAHDWGGVIGWHTVTAHPEKVEKFIVLAAPHLMKFAKEISRNPKQFLMSWYTLFFQISFIPEFRLSRARGKNMVKVMKKSAHRPGAFTDADLEVYRDAWSNIDEMRAGINYYRENKNALVKHYRLYKENKVKCPTCIVWADKDFALSVALAKGMEQWCEIPPEVHILSNCGHWIAQEAPDELYNIIMNFCS